MTKKIRFGRLYDMYGGLLTEKQQAVMEQYFYDDLSLGEIAESCGISRQAVYDLLRRVEQTLEKYESKLQLCMAPRIPGSSSGEPCRCWKPASPTA